MAGFVQAVAVDLDGTIAHGAELDRDALAALGDCRAAGTATLLVTGRIESEFRGDFPDLIGHFQAVVLENGTLLGIADHRTVLAAVDPCLAQNLRTRGVSLREGSGILACHSSDAAAVLDAIAELGLDAQVVHDRSELMVLPAGVSQATGMLAALAELRISAHNTVAIGDAENDLSMLTAAQIGVAAAGAFGTATSTGRSPCPNALAFNSATRPVARWRWPPASRNWTRFPPNQSSTTLFAATSPGGRSAPYRIASSAHCSRRPRMTAQHGCPDR